MHRAGSKNRECQLAFEQRLQDKERVGGSLSQAASEIWIPLVAEWNIDPHVVAVLEQLILQIAADAIEHLEFEPRFVDVPILNEYEKLSDDLLVVGGDGGIVCV